jgi:hypothetical protein
VKEPALILGVDFAGPAAAGAQRRKILAVAARRVAARRYEIAADGLNDRLLRSPPGWTAAELADAIDGSAEPSALIAADFPFSLPAALLASEDFAARIGAPHAFCTWPAFNSAITAALPLTCPLDLGRFAPWRDKTLWLRRVCDVAARAQPPLKDRFQVLFNMTLLGNAFLARLARSGRFDVIPFHDRGRAPIIEVYPGHAMRRLGVPDYKSAPRRAVNAALDHLLKEGITLQLDSAIRHTCETYDTGGKTSHDFDAADALVAACIGLLYSEGLSKETAASLPAVRAVEGTIWSV